MYKRNFVMQKNRQLTKAQLAEFLEFLRTATRATDDDIAYLTSPANQYAAYADWKKDLPLRLPGQVILTNRVKVLYRKYAPRGPGVKPPKKQVPVRLDPSQLDGLKALGGNMSKHIRLAVDAYLKNSGELQSG
jgi:hypothetical protein